MMSSPSVVVVGGGIVGLATAYKLRLRLPRGRIIVLEKEAEVGRHQSGHNSGVLHAGLYYKPGSAKARLAVRGIKEMTAFCQEHGIAHEVCGKLVVATDEVERGRLLDLFERGTRNGLTGLRLLGRDEMREIEPHVAGVAAVHVPEEGIVDYPAVCRTLARLLHNDGAETVTGADVRRLRRTSRGWIVESTAGSYESDFVVTCAGLHSDRLCAMAGERSPARIVPFRGEYYQLKSERARLVRHLIYPVPDPAFPFLGVHFTRMIHGGVECGPNAVLALAREGYRWTIVRPRDLAGTLTYPGFWRFMRRYPGMTWSEVRRSFSKRLFASSLQRLVPELRLEDLAPGGAGVRAQAMRPDGTLVEDFLLVDGAGALHVVNAPSPGATASLAIADEIATRVLDRLGVVVAAAVT